MQTFDEVASADDLEAVMELEGWTNDRLVDSRLKRIPKDQWVYGTTHASVVMAAFLHASPYGARFNTSVLGAWYCSLTIRTALIEVAAGLHREIRRSGIEQLRVQYRSFGARLTGSYEDLRGLQKAVPEVYDAHSWERSQAFGEECRAAGSDGIVWDSVRDPEGTNAVAFKPRQIRRVTAGALVEVAASARGEIAVTRSRP